MASPLVLSSYAFDPAALPYGVAALLAAGTGAGLVLYERFTSASRRFLALAFVMAFWLCAYGARLLATEEALVDGWFRLALGATALTAPLFYGLAQHLTGRRRRRVTLAAWAAALPMAAVAGLAPLPIGLEALMSGSVFGGVGLLGATYALYIGAVIALVIFEFWTAHRGAVSPSERRRHLTMLLAMGVSAIGLLDFVVPPEVTFPSGLAPLSTALSLMIIGVAGARFRVFSVSTRFATDEVLRAMGDAVLVCDRDGIIRMANAEARRLLNVSEAALVGSSVDEWLHGADDEAALGLSHGVPSFEPIHDRHVRLRPREGTSIAASVSMEPVGPAGDARGVIIVARDIRDRLTADRALRAAERQYRSLFWHNPGPAYRIDLEGRIVELNPAAEQLIGATAESMRGRAFMDLIAPGEAERAAELFDSVRRGESQEYEIAVRTLAGEERVIRGVSIPIVHGEEITGVFGVALDMSEEVRAKRELELQRRYLLALFETSPEGIVLLGESDRVVRANAEFSRMFGYAAEEAVGKNLSDLIVPDERRGEALRFNAAAREGDQVRFESVRRRKDGSDVEVSVLARRIVLPGGSEQLYAIYRDIGHRKATERRLREREEELRHAQRLEAVGKLAGGVAHDFNNLLTVINGHAQLALDTLEPDDPLAPDLSAIDQAGTRAASLTQQLLAYSRRQVLQPRLIDANDVIRGLHGMMERLIGSHIRTDVELTQEDARVHADRSRLEQVLVNLVVNARDAMPEGGSLRVETYRVDIPPDDPRPDLWEVEPGSFVRIRVADTGSGMDEETLSRAFEPFFTTKTQGKGTGLGLATVFGIVKQSGGHVVASSRPGEGTTCDVFLPHAAAEPPAGAGVESAFPGGSQEER